MREGGCARGEELPGRWNDGGPWKRSGRRKAQGGTGGKHRCGKVVKTLRMRRRGGGESVRKETGQMGMGFKNLRIWGKEEVMIQRWGKGWRMMRPIIKGQENHH